MDEHEQDYEGIDEEPNQAAWDEGDNYADDQIPDSFEPPDVDKYETYC